MIDFVAQLEKSRNAWYTRPIVAIDVETTGLDPFKDRIIELGLARFEDRKLVWSGSRYVHPERDPRFIDYKALKLNRIEPKMLEGAKPFWQVYNELASVFDGAYPVAYYGSFDRAFIQHAIARAWPRKVFTTLPLMLDSNVRWVDACALARHFLPGLYGYRLGDVVRTLGLAKREAHTAQDDAISAGEIVQNLAVMHHELTDLTRTLTLQRQSEGETVVKKWFQKAGHGEPATGSYSVVECDMCHKLAPMPNGEKLPEGWALFGRNLTTCGPACDIIAGWSSQVW